MPRYTHDPSLVVASLVILPKDEYEFKLGKPKAFERTASKGHQSYGIRIPLTVQGGPSSGKRTVFTIYLHSDGAASMGKRFQMAADGFVVNEKNEKLYDQQVAGKDWSYDTDTGEVGEEWRKYEGLSLVCDVDVQFAKNDKGEDVEQQVWGTWRPVDGAGDRGEQMREVGATAGV